MKHLLAISVGPVQEFIAAARRTIDLTAGSDLLVEIAKAAAEAVAKHGELIFPADLKSDGPNKILAELNHGVEPATVASAAKAAAAQLLMDAWTKALEREEMKKYRIDESLAKKQIGSFLEFYAAWEPFDGSDYPGARERVDSILAARKGLRNFDLSPKGVAAGSAHKAKSPLDPAFECVLEKMPPKREDESQEDEAARNPLHLKQTEYLDAISLLKRAKGQSETGRVPSTRDLAKRQVEAGCLDKNSDEVEEPPPYAYFAVLVADGDNMGDRLSTMQSPDEHREFSRALAKYADAVRSLVKDHDGHPVYAGGDDILAFLPVKTAISCARELAQAFHNLKVDGNCIGATLSAGLAIVHYKEPLAISLAQARAAERRAKKADGKNSLCLALHTRGGTPLSVVRTWTDWADFATLPEDIDRGDPASTVAAKGDDNEFVTWTAAFEKGQVTRGVAYELRDLAREFKCVNTPPSLLKLEAERIWELKGRANNVTPPPIPKWVWPEDKPSSAQFAASLAHFADLLIAARFLTSKGDQNAADVS